MRLSGYLVLAVFLALLLGLVYFTAGETLRAADWSGSDSIAKSRVGELSGGYNPWFAPVWKPQPEIETFLFSVQAAAGALVIGYFIGYNKGYHKGNNNGKLGGSGGLDK